MTQSFLVKIAELSESYEVSSCRSPFQLKAPKKETEGLKQESYAWRPVKAR